MYFVDRQRLEKTLRQMEAHMALFKSQKQWESAVEKLALERLVHVVIEAFLDVGNQMIDGFIMRDPGSYNDIVDILIDENVVPKESETGLKAVIALRKALVHDYANIDHGALIDTFARHFAVWSAFPGQVRRYLENELGPVSAFKPDGDAP